MGFISCSYLCLLCDSLVCCAVLAIWVPANLFAIVAIKTIGISVAVGTWAGISVLVSFTWGALVFQDPVKNIWLTLLGLLLLVLGIVGLALCPMNPPQPTSSEDMEQNAENSSNKQEEEEGAEAEAEEGADEVIVSAEALAIDTDHHYDRDHEMEDVEIAKTTSVSPVDEQLGPHREEPLSDEPSSGLTTYATNPDEISSMTKREAKKELKQRIVTSDSMKDVVLEQEEGSTATASPPSLTWKQKLDNAKFTIIGFICCVLVGLLGGSMMVPLRYGPNLGIVYAISFSTGVMIVTLVLFVAYFIVRSAMARQVVLPEFQLKAALVPGLISGALWSVGNVCATYASLSPLGLTVGFPLTQVSLLIAGLYGIILFREMSGVRSIGQFIFSACLLLLPGCMLLAMFGKR